MRPATRDSYLDAIQRVIAHVALHLDDALDLESLAADACLSPFHFHRVFRGMVGETPMEFVRRLRLERAAWQLATSIVPVTTVAFEAGYEAHEAFTRAFRQHFGASPSEFRATPRTRHHLAASCGVHFDPRGGVVPFVPRSTGGSIMHVEIDQQPARRLATVRHIGPYNQIGRAFAELGRRLGPAMGALAMQGPAMIALYHDAPESVAPDELRSDAAVVVPDDFALPDGVVEQRLPAGRYASTLHVGPYEQLGDVWLRFMGEWLPASGERVAASPAVETYLNNPETTPKSEWRTLLSIPLA
ncbi:MAG: AraC family transcriptional regulator [Vicinamibacterales bacterium]